MPFTQFKFVQTGRNALTRRVTFAEQPSWFSLASRIEQLCGVPLQDVGVSYIDSDGDEITLSTHEELQDYYATVPRYPNEAIRFTIKNIGALRAENRPRPQHPSSSSNNMYEIIVDDDWQPDVSGIPLFSRSNPPPPPPKSPSSAFVETVESSDTVDPAAAQDNRSESSSVAVLVTDKKENVREGKRPLYIGSDTSDASSVSVIHDDVPDKQPVHVLEFDTEQGYVHDRSPKSHSKSSRPSRPFSPIMRGSRSISRSDSSSRSPSPVIRIRSSPPRSRSRSPVEHIMTTISERSPSVHADILADPPSPVLISSPIPDPPLPTAGTPLSAAAPLPSLGRDVAELLGALTTAFASHPELSEGLKNIVRNASQGAYWSAERDVMVNNALRAAETAQDEVSRAAQHAQEEAGRKVSDALSGVFRALGSIINSAASQESEQTRPESYGNAPEPEIFPSRDRPPSYRHTGIFPARNSSPLRTIIMPMPRSPSKESRRPDLPRPRSLSPPTREPERPRAIIVPMPRSPSKESRRAGLFGPRSLSPPAREPDRRETSPEPDTAPGPPNPVPPVSGHYESRRSPFYYRPYRPPSPLPSPPSAHYRYPSHRAPAPPVPSPPLPHPWRPLHNPPPPSPPHPHLRHPLHGPLPPIPPPPGPPLRSSSPHAVYHPAYPPMWVGHRALVEQHALRRGRTLPGSYGAPPRIHGPLSGPSIPLCPAGTMVASNTAQRKAELEEAKQYYKAKKEEWRREKEARRLEKEKRELERMERIRKRERRAASTRQVVIFDDVEEAPPPVPPHPAELLDSSPLRGAIDGGVTDFKRPSDGDGRYGVLMNRLAGMGFTPKTHPQLEALLGKHLHQQVGSRSFTEEAVIANLLEELFLEGADGRPEDRAGPSVNIPGSWGV